MRKIIFLAIVLAVVSCSKTPELPSEPFEFKGSWYTDLKDASGAFDPESDYMEMYVSDTAIFFQMETAGTSLRKYYIVDDSMYQCVGMRGRPCTFYGMYKINRYYHDTLWLTSPRQYTIGDTVSYWVRFPKDEYGPADLTWTPATKDSLQLKVMYDYSRRTIRYHDLMKGRKAHYDSLLKAGEWNWTMKSVRKKQRRDSIANLVR